MQATLDTCSAPPLSEAAPPETIRTARLYEGVARLKRYREEVTANWFSLPAERRDFYRRCPFLDENKALQSLGWLTKASSVLRVLYHMVLQHDDYFNALRDHYREAGRLAEVIRRRLEEEEYLQAKLAEEALEGYVPSQGQLPVMEVQAIPLDTDALRRRREARRSGATR
jgi:hypothetical protein